MIYGYFRPSEAIYNVNHPTIFEIRPICMLLIRHIFTFSLPPAVTKEKVNNKLGDTLQINSQFLLSNVPRRHCEWP